MSSTIETDSNKVHGPKDLEFKIPTAAFNFLIGMPVFFLFVVLASFTLGYVSEALQFSNELGIALMICFVFVLPFALLALSMGYTFRYVYRFNTGQKTLDIHSQVYCFKPTLRESVPFDQISEFRVRKKKGDGIVWWRGNAHLLDGRKLEIFCYTDQSLSDFYVGEIETVIR